jgi:hypothetical protein
MSDLIARLRGPAPSIPAMRDAADEIERLQRLTDNLLEYLNGISRQTAEMVKANTTAENN